MSACGFDFSSATRSATTAEPPSTYWTFTPAASVSASNWVWYQLGVPSRSPSALSIVTTLAAYATPAVAVASRHATTRIGLVRVASTRSPGSPGAPAASRSQRLLALYSDRSMTAAVAILDLPPESGGVGSERHAATGVTIASMLALVSVGVR